MTERGSLDDKGGASVGLYRQYAMFLACKTTPRCVSCAAHILFAFVRAFLPTTADALACDDGSRRRTLQRCTNTSLRRMPSTRIHSQQPGVLTQARSHDRYSRLARAKALFSNTARPLHRIALAFFPPRPIHARTSLKRAAAARPIQPSFRSLSDLSTPRQEVAAMPLL